MVLTTKRKKLEILLDAPLLKRVRSLANEAGVSGYTLYPTIGGEGEFGRWLDDQVTGGAGSKILFVTIANEETTDLFLQSIVPLLDEYGLIVLISDIDVIRANRF